MRTFSPWLVCGLVLAAHFDPAGVQQIILVLLLLRR
jgi:hypothetical protein